MTDRLAPGARLFFLEDSAVLFSEPRQELHEFNAMAAVIWCHLEDGKERPDIARELVSQLGLSEPDAARFVDQALDTWKLQGLLADRPGPIHAAPPQPRQPPSAAPDFGTPAFATERSYQLLSVGFRLRCTAESDDALLASMLGHLESTATPVTSFDVVRRDDAITIYRDGRPLAICRATEELAPTVYGLVWLEIADQHGFFLQLHAGVVAGRTKDGGRACILLPARPGSGKTTLTAALVHAGWDYLSDEIALMDAQTMRVAPMPISFCLKRSGAAPVAEFWPAARGLQFHLRSDGKQVAYLPPPVERVVAPDARLDVRAIVFPRYRKDHVLEWHGLSRLDALRRLIGECVAISGPLTVVRVQALVDWIANLACYELTYGSTGDALSAIGKAFGDPRDMTIPSNPVRQEPTVRVPGQIGALGQEQTTLGSE